MVIFSFFIAKVKILKMWQLSITSPFLVHLVHEKEELFFNNSSSKYDLDYQFKRVQY
jgi:hypothetical protein